MGKQAKKTPSALEYMTSQLHAAFAALGHALGAIEEQNIEEEKAAKRSRKAQPPKRRHHVDPPPAGKQNKRRNAPSGDSHYIVQGSYVSVWLPGATAPVRTSFRRVAVLEVDANVNRVSSISLRAAGCRRVVAVWERRFVGHSDRTTYGRACIEAEALAKRLNAGANLTSSLTGCSADCILPTAEELNASRTWDTGAIEWVDWDRPKRLSAAEIQARVAA
jgi:hypothetical protein